MKIESGIPLPPKRASYKFGGMRVGDCMFVEGEAAASGNTLGRPAKAATAARVFGKNHGMQFTAETNLDGVRIWRVS